jgi:hypothetical protein
MAGAVPGHARAERLKARILKYWSERGETPLVWIEVGRSQDGDPCPIRSDMVNGRPRPENK